MATRARSWSIAIGAALCGSALFFYDDVLEAHELHKSAVHRVAEGIEFLLLSPGMGVLAFVICEYLRLDAARLRIERERANQQRFLALGRIAASIAHEVRNPLHNIRLLLDERRQADGAGGDQLLDSRVQANLERINRAVELVYQLAKPAGGAAQAEVGVDLIALMAEAAAAERQRSGVEVVGELPAGTAPVSCSAATVRIVLDNLLRNAGASARTVRIAVRPGTGTWEAVITNPGGLPPELIGDGADEPVESAKYGGLGLGLFVSRQLLRNVGGTLLLAQRGSEVEAVMRLPAWSEASA